METNNTRNSNLHTGHRKRMKDKLLKNGEHTFLEHEILEMLLYYSFPRQDTNEIAHQLLEEFGSIEEILSAPSARLMKIKGIKEHSIVLFRLVKAINRLSAQSNEKPSALLNTFSAVNKFLSDFYATRTKEVLCILFLDSSMKLIDIMEEGSNEKNHATLSPGVIVRYAMDVGATNVIIAHNHLSDNSVPSIADMDFTSKLETALSVFEINLIEHFIVNKSGAHPTMRIRLSRMSSNRGNGLMSSDFLHNFYNS